MAEVMRCPYCVQDGNFRPMKPRFEGRWFMCEICSHTVMQNKPSFECQCRNCKQFFRPLKNEN